MLERHPKLKILAVHGGGYLGGYSGRIDHAWGARSDAHGTLPNPPTTYLKRVYVDTVVFTPYQLAELVRVFGTDHVVIPEKVNPIVPKENVISRFLGLLTDGQYRMQNIAQAVNFMASDTTREINPAKLLLIQIKVGQIQQELEFFAAVLNKALESTKTIMNVQV